MSAASGAGEPMALPGRDAVFSSPVTAVQVQVVVPKSPAPVTRLEAAVVIQCWYRCQHAVHVTHQKQYERQFTMTSWPVDVHAWIFDENLRRRLHTPAVMLPCDGGISPLLRDEEVCLWFLLRPNV